MKKYIFYILISSVLFCSGCYDDEIILSKPGEAIDPVTNLNHTITDNSVVLTWDLPATYPADIIKPVSVLVRIWEDGRNTGTQVLADAPESLTQAYDPAKKYKYTVKVQGAVNSTDPYVSKLRISPGQTITF